MMLRTGVHRDTDLLVKLVIGRKEWRVTEFNLASFLSVASLDCEHCWSWNRGRRQLTEACAALIRCDAS